MNENQPCILNRPKASLNFLWFDSTKPPSSSSLPSSSAPITTLSSSAPSPAHSLPSTASATAVSPSSPATAAAPSFPDSKARLVNLLISCFISFGNIKPPKAAGSYWTIQASTSNDLDRALKCGHFHMYHDPTAHESTPDKAIALIGLPTSGNDQARLVINHLSNLLEQDLRHLISPKQVSFRQTKDGLFKATVHRIPNDIYDILVTNRFMFINGDGIYIRPSNATGPHYPQESCLLLAGLPTNWQANRLDHLFAAGLGIESVKIAYHPSGKSRGFAYIGFKNAADAQAVLNSPTPYQIPVRFGKNIDYATFVPVDTPLCPICRKPHDKSDCSIKLSLDARLQSTSQFLNGHTGVSHPGIRKGKASDAIQLAKKGVMIPIQPNAASQVQLKSLGLEIVERESQTYATVARTSIIAAPANTP